MITDIYFKIIFNITNNILLLNLQTINEAIDISQHSTPKESRSY
jgi:hypothetical protein